MASTQPYVSTCIMSMRHLRNVACTCQRNARGDGNLTSTARRHLDFGLSLAAVVGRRRRARPRAGSERLAEVLMLIL